ncbi:MAG: thiamine diphosphokinase [Dehalococcoidia bacterium]|nr:thiamine diphosphokinase [Dehalococcoidia bacterium]
MQALIIANGEPPSDRLLRGCVSAAALVVGADGGADVARRAGITVHLATGDLDSITDAVRDSLGPARLFVDRDPNRTDLQKALDLCIARGATSVDVLAAGGGRPDHALANLSLLFHYRGRARVRLVDDQFLAFGVDGREAIDAPPGTIVSLVAIGRCEGVTTRGLRWDLDHYPLTFSPYGVHNEVATSPASVSVERGDLLVFQGRYIDRHQ